jgi:hypothetical protein
LERRRDRPVRCDSADRETGAAAGKVSFSLTAGLESGAHLTRWPA